MERGSLQVRSVKNWCSSELEELIDFSKNFKKEVRNIKMETENKKNQWEMKESVIKMKNTLEGIN